MELEALAREFNSFSTEFPFLKDSSEEIKTALQKKEVMYGIHFQLRDLIKNITGCDFQSPIIVGSVII